MSRCPGCRQQHRGPRDVMLLHGEGCQVLARSLEMPTSVAAEYLRSQWLGGALELAGWCSSCIFQHIAATCPASVSQAVAKVEATLQAAGAPTPEQIEKAYVEGGPLHVCTVIPMERHRARAVRELLGLGSPKPGGAS